MDWGGHVSFLFAADFADKSAKICEIHLREALRRTGLRDILSEKTIFLLRFSFNSPLNFNQPP